MDVNIEVENQVDGAEVQNQVEGAEEDSSQINDEVGVIPVVSMDLKPQVGKEFDSLDDVYEFYKTYARNSGFGIRKHSSKRTRFTNEIVRKEFVCCRQGCYEPPEDPKPKRMRGKCREGCKARVVASKGVESNKYIISWFTEKHNHIMSTPDKVHLLRSHRIVTESKKVFNRDLSAANISTHQQMSLLEVQVGGMENVGCTSKDLYNWERDLHAKLIGHDAELLKEHFLAERKKNYGFYFKMEADSNGRLTNFFWADATSRRSYGFYGDVVVFDTTYNTNRYGMVFAPLIGLNNHGHTIVFACAFLVNETVDSFVWLFEEFKKAMPGTAPKMIITDQDAAMAKAIVQSLPTTFHRYCIWHIMNKFSEKLNSRYHTEELRSCIWNIDKKEEFDVKWQEVVGNNGLKDHIWLNSIFDLRHNWVPAYCKHVFSAGMSSSQRAESSHAFFKQYVCRKNSLMEFIVRFERALAHQRDKELTADHIDHNEEPRTQLSTPMERQVRDIYTREMLQKFQREQMRSVSCFLERTNSYDTICVYNVTERVTPGVSKVKDVVYDKSDDVASCSCKLFEYSGIPCRHLLAFLRKKQVEHLPEKYILKRWMKSAKSGVVFDTEGNVIKDCIDNGHVSKRSMLSMLSGQLIDDALLSEEGSKLLQQTFEGLKPTLKSLGKTSKCASSTVENVGNSSNQIKLKDPQHVRSKGRVKGGNEKAVDRLRRRCTECRKTQHDKQNRPLVVNTSPPCNAEDTNQNTPSTQNSQADLFMQEFDATFGPRSST